MARYVILIVANSSKELKDKFFFYFCIIFLEGLSPSPFHSLFFLLSAGEKILSSWKKLRDVLQEHEVASFNKF